MSRARLIVPLRFLKVSEAIENLIFEDFKILPYDHEIIKQLALDDQFVKSFGIGIASKMLGIPWLYYDGEIDGLTKYSGHKRIELLLADINARVNQYFNYLWLQKDHSVTPEDCLLIIENFDHVYADYRTEIFSNCVGDQISVEFNQDEFSIGNEDFTKLAFKERPQRLLRKENINRPAAPIPDVIDHIVRPFERGEYNLHRVERAILFLQFSRQTAFLLQKISNYIIMMECLFGIENNKICHNVSERASLYIGQTKVERALIYKNSKKAYNVRSRFVHGQNFTFQGAKDDYSQAAEISKIIDDLLRKVINSALMDEEPFYNDNDLLKHFRKLKREKI